MSDKFTVNISLQNGNAQIKLSGLMDEDMDLGQLKSVNESVLFFDLDQVAGINSCGIRDWIAFLGELGGGQKVVYDNCPQVLIEQMNMVKGFIPEGAEIKSFYAPFYCESCDNEEKVLLKPSDVLSDGGEAKAPKDLKCSSCGAEGLEFDALEAQYFHFLK